MKYSIDGNDFKDYGVYVSSSAGLLGGLKVKRAIKSVWEDESGYAIDEGEAVVFEPRSITLSCFLCAEDSVDAMDKLKAFAALFYRSGQRVLSVSVGEKAMEYGVVLNELAEVKSVFAQGNVAATFVLKMEELSPSL